MQFFFLTINLVIFVCLTLLGCQNRTIAITPYSDARPAKRVVQDLREAKDDTALSQILSQLQERRGDHLDWTDFWELMGEASDLHTRLLPKHQEKLLSLHGRSCDTRSFSQFTRFLLLINQGADQLLTPKRKCKTGLSGELALAVFRQQLPPEGLNAQTLEKKEVWLNFLTGEINRTPDSSLWLSHFSENDNKIMTSLLTNLLEVHRLDEVLLFTGAYVKLGNGVFGAKLLKDHLYSDVVAIDYFITRFGHIETLRFLSYIATDDSSAKEIEFYTESRMKLAVNRLMRDPFLEVEKNTDLVWEHYLHWRFVISSITRHWGITSRLRLLTQQQREIEKWFLNQTESEREWFFTKRIKSVLGTSELGDFAWLILRLFGPKSPFLKVAGLEQLEKTSATDLLDLALQYRLKVHLSKDMEQRRKATKDYRLFLESEGLATLSKNKTELNDLFRRELDAGCFQFIGPEAPVFTGPQKISMSFDSIISIPSTMASFEAPLLSLGILDLSEPISLAPAENLSQGKLGPQGGKLLLISNEPPGFYGFVSLGAVDPYSGKRGIDGGTLWQKKN